MSESSKVVIVTGASSGIGRSIAFLYAEKGYKVVLADVNQSLGEENVQHIKSSGGEAIFCQTDVRVEEDIISLMDIAYETYGKIDVLINNAGRMVFKSLFEIKIEEWDDLMNTNLRSVFLASKEAAKYMMKHNEGGSIVNIASTRSLMSEPNSELYAASKGGIVSLTHALAASLSKHHISVNAISPGWIETGDYQKLTELDHSQHFSNRVGKPEDIARACLFLSAAENDFVTGTNLIIDGGMTRKMIYQD
ncbi:MULTISPECIES: glucose 1-dehydrogenase [Bacillus]|uniref:glucose 1-dehydrogenase n=1 Tax=Bacillus TaxID=1386 RepID=UPI0002E7DCF1|nr:MULTISPECIES: glucose 1-dehydrogenase [Bacillus]